MDTGFCISTGTDWPFKGVATQGFAFGYYWTDWPFKSVAA